MLAQSADAPGEEARRIANAYGALNIPRIIGVLSSDTYKGDDWLGLKMRDASVVRGIGVLPLFAGMLGLLLLIGSLAATWLREGREPYSSGRLSETRRGVIAARSARRPMAGSGDQ